MAEHDSRVSALTHAPLHVLLIEDDRFDAEIATELLRSLDAECEVTVVDDETRFLATIAAKRVDIILSDFALPNFSGPEALALAQKMAPETPFIFVSGVLGEENAVDMLKLGATDYVVKSRMQRLPFVVKRAISEARERRERIEVQRALHTSESLFSRVVESLRDYAFMLLAPDGLINTWNSAAQAIFGYSSNEAIGRNAAMLYDVNDQESGVFAKELEIAQRTGRASDDRWLVAKGGKPLFANGVTTALTNDAGELIGFSKIVRDGTEARFVSEALEAAKVAAELANQAKSRFLAVLSHELRTPLTPILAAAGILENRVAVPPELANLLPMIRRNVALEARLIDDLLDLTSIEHDKLVLNMQAMDIHTALMSALDMSRDDIAHKRLQLSLQLEARNGDVLGDEARVQQIFWNLLRNAVKFTGQGGSILLRSANPDEENIAVSVTDSGIGISEQALPRIFMQFEQADPSISRKFGGLGLGLAIARALAVRHGGQLSVTSDGEGKGATFTLTLPLRSRQQRELDSHAAEGETESPPRPLQNVRILLVEDNVDAADALSVALQQHDYRVTAVHSVKAAREALREDGYDLLISDIGLPDGTGYDVIAATDGKLPAIALSGYGMRSDTSRSAQSGFFSHIVKPVDLGRLDTAIQAALASRHD